MIELATDELPMSSGEFRLIEEPHISWAADTLYESLLFPPSDGVDRYAELSGGVGDGDHSDNPI
jgi:hypothetical protein